MEFFFTKYYYRNKINSASYEANSLGKLKIKKDLYRMIVGEIQGKRHVYKLQCSWGNAVKKQGARIRLDSSGLGSDSAIKVTDILDSRIEVSKGNRHPTKRHPRK
jgi:hypothetical protein